MKQHSLDFFLKQNSSSQTNNPSQPSNPPKTNPPSKPHTLLSSHSKPSKHTLHKPNTPDPDLNPALIPSIPKEKTFPTTTTPSTHSLPFSSLVTVLSKIESTKGENSKDIIKTLFSNLFTEIISSYPHDLPLVYYFLLSKVGPSYKTPEFGIGNGIMERAVGKVIGMSDNQIKDKMKDIGDLAIIASEGKKTVKTMDKFAGFVKVSKVKELTINDVMKCYKDITEKKGKSSMEEKMKLLCALMFRANKDEIKYIVRSLTRSLKIGASFKTIIFSLGRCISQIFKGNINEKETTKYLLISIHQLSDEDIVFNHIINLIKTNNVNEFKTLPQLCMITPGIPVNPQLARPTNGINVIFKRFENIKFTCEYKYDGFRGQIHYNNINNKTEVFSRNLENMTETFPDIVEYVKQFIHKSNEQQQITSFIIDCEMVAFDKVNNKILPFQQLTTRSRKNVDISQITIHVCMFVFDILYLNGESLMHKTLQERREILYNTFTENEYIQFAKQLISDNTSEIESFMNESILAGCEGLIIKALEKNSEYMPGQRNFNWLKLKKDYLNTSIGDSIDLIIIGAAYGKGKRVGKYGSFLLACYNDDSETYETVTMTGGGLKDEDIDKMYNDLQEYIIPHPKSNYRIGLAEVDVFFEPCFVWEVKTADLTMSPIYTAGYEEMPQRKGISLRFSRFIRPRPDKKPEEATTSEYMVKLYKEQASVNNNVNIEFGDDLDDLY